MKRLRHAVLCVALFIPACHGLEAAGPAGDTADAFLWLEDRESPASLDWVRAQDSTTFRELRADSNFASFQEEMLTILNDQDRIPDGTLIGNYIYNFWQDADHVRGIYRRTTIAQYAKPEPAWETVLDIDSLNAAEQKSWVFHGMSVLPPENRRALVSLSDGGKDASYEREFDLKAKRFVPGGFALPEAKSRISWVDDSTVLVGTDFGPGSLTASGYPRIVKLWKRGTPLDSARTLMAGETSDVNLSGSVSFRPEGKIEVLWRGLSFWETQKWVVDADGQPVEIPLPKDAAFQTVFAGRIVAMLYCDWMGIPEGSIVALRIADLKAEDPGSKVEIIFRPDDTTTATGVTTTKDHLLVTVLRIVRGRVLAYSLKDSSGVGTWSPRELNVPDFGAVEVVTSDDFSNVFMLTVQDFLTPTRLLMYDGPDASPVEVKALPPKFDASNITISQGHAISADGTRIPYFMVAQKGLKLDGQNPTLLYGYGGFRIPETPYYSVTMGKLWVGRGGVFVLANIRGGGEFGPRWHKAALLKNRQKCYDDFIAVAEDLIARGITTPRHLGIEGGSNGGLLVGVAMTQRPDLFNAVVCQVPLLDMLRYTKLPPGASWVGEYGDPDSADIRPYIAAYSPYQNV